ncbi:MAG: PD40 domain-containing protein, partial [Caldilineaceae bacterium]|nr:PD40 domain-containing protein [Caldilineaceae bacterium]
AGQDGSAALRLNHLSDDGPAQALQMLHLPTTVSAATLSYIVRIEPGQQPAGVMATFGAQILTDSEVLFEDAYQINGAVAWTPISTSLPADAITKVQQAFDAGQQIYLRMVLVNGQGAYYTAFVDNLSLRVDGDMAYPSLTGSIGFISRQGQQPTVNRIQPDGSARQTLWTHPDTIAPDVYDVAWRPDAKELAFVSDHEGAYSPFHSDIYAVDPVGNALRRISNAPMQAGWPNGRQTGAITGRIYNGYASFGLTFVVYVEGAQEVISVNMPEFGQDVAFNIPNVADNGPGALQTIVFNWSRDNCANGKEFSVPVDVLPGQTVDVGTINFNGYCNQYNVSDLSWKGDGAAIGGVMLNGSRRFAVGGESIGQDLFTGTENFPQDLSWSPINDQILSTRQTQAVNDGIFQGTAGGDAGSQISIDNQSSQQNPAWLPNGSGFVFTYNNNVIGRYDVNSNQATALVAFFNESIDNLSVSPDGNYAVFERTNAQGTADIWVVSLSKPNLMWPLTSDGVSRNPDWSRVEPSVAGQPTNTPTSTATSQPGATNTPTATATSTSTPVPGATSTPTSTPGAERIYLPGVRR